MLGEIAFKEIDEDRRRHGVVTSGPALNTFSTPSRTDLLLTTQQVLEFKSVPAHCSQIWLCEGAGFTCLMLAPIKLIVHSNDG